MGENFAFGNLGHVGISDAQTALSTPATIVDFVTPQAGVDLKLRQPNNSVIRDAIRSNAASSTSRVKGIKSVDGSLPFYFHPDEGMGKVIAMAMGNYNTVAANGDGYTHTFNPWTCTAGQNFSEFGVTIQVNAGSCDDSLVFNHVGMFCNSLQIASPESGGVVVTAGLVGEDKESGTAATPSYSDISVYEDYMAHIEVGSVIGSTSAIDIKSATFSLTNNVEMVYDRSQTSRVASDRKLGNREVTLEFTLTQKQNTDLYEYFVNNTINAMKFVLTHESEASSGVPYSLTINLPRIIWTGDGCPDLNDTASYDVTYSVTALLDDTTGYDVQMILINTQSGTYSV